MNSWDWICKFGNKGGLETITAEIKVVHSDIKLGGSPKGLSSGVVNHIGIGNSGLYRWGIGVEHFCLKPRTLKDCPIY